MQVRRIIGSICIVVGVLIAVAGYEKTQPTWTEKTIDFAAGFVGQRIPDSLRADRTDAYVLIGIGVVVVCLGVTLNVEQNRG